jgi:hypothetical protein
VVLWTRAQMSGEAALIRLQAATRGAGTALSGGMMAGAASWPRKSDADSAAATRIALRGQHGSRDSSRRDLD